MADRFHLENLPVLSGFSICYLRLKEKGFHLYSSFYRS